MSEARVLEDLQSRDYRLGSLRELREGSDTHNRFGKISLAVAALRLHKSIDLG